MFKYFLKREIYDRYIGNVTGVSWVFIQPVLTLLIYTLVFDKIFGARVPEAEDIGFIVYLALGFWPWMAFSESVLKSITAVSDKKDLIGKINLNFKIPVIATVSASFALNLIGYIIVLLTLVLFGKQFNYLAILLLIFPILQLYLLAIALSLILSALQVYIRDTLHLMTTVMTLWFFLTPIIYSVSILPESIKVFIQLNPIYIPITFIHNALITNKELPWVSMLYLTISILILLWLANKIFNRLSPRFEEFI